MMKQRGKIKLTDQESDIRVVAMAKEWCRMIGKDPDQMIRSAIGKERRYLGYMSNMRRLLAAAEDESITPAENGQLLTGRRG